MRNPWIIIVNIFWNRKCAKNEDKTPKILPNLNLKVRMQPELKLTKTQSHIHTHTNTNKYTQTHTYTHKQTHTHKRKLRIAEKTGTSSNVDHNFTPPFQNSTFYNVFRLFWE